jgi:hypothetical protein
MRTVHTKTERLQGALTWIAADITSLISDLVVPAVLYAYAPRPMLPWHPLDTREATLTPGNFTRAQHETMMSQRKRSDGAGCCEHARPVILGTSETAESVPAVELLLDL